MIFLSWPALWPRPAALHQPGRWVLYLLQSRVPGFQVGFAEENLGQVEKESHFEFSWNIPNRAGTIAELHEGRKLPAVLVDLVTDTPWCEEVQEYVPMDDPARVHLTSKAGSKQVAESDDLCYY